MNLTAQDLRDEINYDPDTGEFRLRETGTPLGRVASDGYIFLKVRGKKYTAARLAWLYMTGEMPTARYIDHINSNRRDNRWCNLRLASNAENLQNRGVQKNSSSGIKGVYKDRGRWRARIMAFGKQVNLGCFGTPEDARIAYNRAVFKMHGEFARAA